MTSYIEHPDYLALSKASMQVMLTELSRVCEGADDPAVPPATSQVADTIAGHAIRLIRSGTSHETRTASRLLAQAAVNETGLRLKARDPDAYRVLDAAAEMLCHAAHVNSASGHIQLLRNWNEAPARVLRMMLDAPDDWISQRDVEAVIGAMNVEGTPTSVVSEMERAGLIVRCTRETGRTDVSEPFCAVGPRGTNAAAAEYMRGVGAAIP